MAKEEEDKRPGSSTLYTISSQSLLESSVRLGASHVEAWRCVLRGVENQPALARGRRLLSVFRPGQFHRVRLCMMVIALYRERRSIINKVGEQHIRSTYSVQERSACGLRITVATANATLPQSPTETKPTYKRCRTLRTRPDKTFMLLIVRRRSNTRGKGRSACVTEHAGSRKQREDVQSNIDTKPPSHIHIDIHSLLSAPV